jgi:hypothetical protein
MVEEGGAPIEGRSRRANAGKGRTGAAAKSALEELRALKADGGVGRRAATFEVKEAPTVYDVVDEKGYAEVVARRRREGGALSGSLRKFIVILLLSFSSRWALTSMLRPRTHLGGFLEDDVGDGYADVGEEIDWTVEEGGNEESTQLPQKRKGKATKGKYIQTPLPPSKAGHRKVSRPLIRILYSMTYADAKRSKFSATPEFDPEGRKKMQLASKAANRKDQCKPPDAAAATSPLSEAVVSIKVRSEGPASENYLNKQ